MHPSVTQLLAIIATESMAENGTGVGDAPSLGNMGLMLC
jgi:hypothetical protein